MLPAIQVDVRKAGIHGALASLQQVAGLLQARGDARAIFPDVYAVITRTVRDGIEKGLFLEPDFISSLAGCFASLYVETLSRSLTGTAQESLAWGLAYERAQAEGSLPAEHAGLGISAHINYDLALGIYQTIRRLGVESDPAMLARFKHDHDAVNALLEKSLPECLVRLVDTYGCSGTPLLTGGLRRFATNRIMSTLSKWRERVWANVLALLDAPDEQTRQTILDTMNRTALREGQWISALCRTGWLLVH